MIRTILTGVAAAGGAYAAGPEEKMMMDLLKGTPLDPTAVEYTATGLDPAWAFATVAVVGMGPTIARTFQDWIKSRNVRAERTLEAKLGGYIERGPPEKSDAA